MCKYFHLQLSHCNIIFPYFLFLESFCLQLISCASIRAPKLNCEDDSCPVEIIHPPEDCNLNSSLSFTLQVHSIFEHSLYFPGRFSCRKQLMAISPIQVCRVEDIDVWGLVQGTVIHFNRARTVTVHKSGTISASGLGNFFIHLVLQEFSIACCVFPAILIYRDSLCPPEGS